MHMHMRGREELSGVWGGRALKLDRTRGVRPRTNDLHRVERIFAVSEMFEMRFLPVVLCAHECE